MTDTVGGLLLRSARRWPDADALVEEETVLSHAGAASAAVRVAQPELRVCPESFHKAFWTLRG